MREPLFTPEKTFACEGFSLRPISPPKHGGDAGGILSPGYGGTNHGGLDGLRKPVPRPPKAQTLFMAIPPNVFKRLLGASRPDSRDVRFDATGNLKKSGSMRKGSVSRSRRGMYTCRKLKGSDDPDNRLHGGGEMKSTKVIIAVVALSIAAGLFVGYRIWGIKDQGKGDIQQLLRTLEEEVARIDQKNKDLVASLEASRGDIEASEAVRKENQELKDRLQGALQEKQGLESSLAEWKAKEIDAKKQAEAEQELRKVQDELKNKIAGLKSGNQVLADRLQQAEQKIAEKEGLLAEVRNELAEAREKASRGEEFRQLSQDLSTRISELESENQELRSVIDNISKMTQRQQETR